MQMASGVVEDSYRGRHRKSAACNAEAVLHMPGGSTRTAVFYSPFPLTWIKGVCNRLTDIDGLEYLDLLGEYSAGLYGHSNPIVQVGIKQSSWLKPYVSASPPLIYCGSPILSAHASWCLRVGPLNAPFDWLIAEYNDIEGTTEVDIERFVAAVDDFMAAHAALINSGTKSVSAVNCASVTNTRQDSPRSA